jgi:hypothetical protein
VRISSLRVASMERHMPPHFAAQLRNGVVTMHSPSISIAPKPPAGAAKRKGVVDLVFVLDATGSMAPCIEAVKRNIRAFIATLAAGTGRAPNSASAAIDWRIRIVGYRDANYSPDWLLDNPFVRSVDEAHAQLDALEVGDGGDEPESLLEAIHAVCSTPESERGNAEDPKRWRHRREACRVVVILTDASFHPVMAGGAAAGGAVEDVQNAVMNARVYLRGFVPDMECYVGLESIDRADLQRIPFDASKPHGAIEALEKWTRDQKSFARVMDALAKSISQTAEVSVLTA